MKLKLNIAVAHHTLNTVTPHPVKAIKVEVPFVDAFAAKPCGFLWYVYEWKTGLKISGSKKSKKAAVADAIDILNKLGREATELAVSRNIF